VSKFARGRIKSRTCKESKNPTLKAAPGDRTSHCDGGGSGGDNPPGKAFQETTSVRFFGDVK
jgi:hypothetical protein